MIKIKGQKSI